jgi:hypothetical protein
MLISRQIRIMACRAVLGGYYLLWRVEGSKPFHYQRYWQYHTRLGGSYLILWLESSVAYSNQFWNQCLLGQSCHCIRSISVLRHRQMDYWHACVGTQ